MFLTKLFHFLKGYVIIEVTGGSRERFLNILVRRKINPIYVNTVGDVMLLKMKSSDFFGIREVAFKTKCHIKLKKKAGLPFIVNRLKARTGFLIGFASVVTVFAVSSQFIWTVEIEPTQTADREKVLAAVEKAGIKVGALKCRLPQPMEMKNTILVNTDDITWAWVSIEGTRAYVSLRENILPPEVVDLNKPCDIVAMEDGMIKQVIATKGKCVAEPGDTVQKGDVLISGSYSLGENASDSVHSSGEVLAYTYHIKSDVFKTEECFKRYSGRKRRRLTLKIFSLEIPLYFGKSVPFAEYEEESSTYEFMGIGCRTATYTEYETVRKPISYDVAVEAATDILEERIAKELLFGSEMTERKVSAEKYDDETIKVTVKMGFIEQIGTEKEITGGIEIEPKTD